MPTPARLPTTLAPWLNVQSGGRAAAFYQQAFGAEVEFQTGEPENLVARLSVDGAVFWLSDESPLYANFSPPALGGSTVRLVLTVSDPQAVFARALAAGAEQIAPVTEAHGWLSGRLLDPFGHHWEIGRPLV